MYNTFRKASMLGAQKSYSEWRTSIAAMMQGHSCKDPEENSPYQPSGTSTSTFVLLQVLPIMDLGCSSSGLCLPHGLPQHLPEESALHWHVWKLSCAALLQVTEPLTACFPFKCPGFQTIIVWRVVSKRQERKGKMCCWS